MEMSIIFFNCGYSHKDKLFQSKILAIILNLMWNGQFFIKKEKKVNGRLNKSIQINCSYKQHQFRG